MLRILIGLVVALLLVGPAEAQEELSIARVHLGLPGASCTLHAASGAPSGSLGAVCDIYHRTDSPYTIYVKTGASTWTAVVQMPSSAAAGDLIAASSATVSARIAAVATGQVLASNGTSTLPVYTASPSLTSIGGAANLTINPTGDVVFNPTGNDLLPTTGYDLNIGSLTTKFLTLHAAELWVETLVAQNTIATIGGRILVGPTTTLTSDLSSGATSIVVRHNQIANGDRLYLEADGKVEFLAVTSGASGGGPYTYSVTRNLDGSGANDWYAGDAVFNTGTTGDGFIDLYSVSAVNGPAVFGPAIVGNVRTGTTYSQIAPRWAIGNLNGVYGYGADTYGAAFGDFTNSYLTVDATNGIRMIGDAGTMFSMDTAGVATFAGRLTVGTGRNWLSNTEFRLETFAGATAADGPATGVPGSNGVTGGTNSKWRHGFYSGTGTPTWRWWCNFDAPVNADFFPAGSGACGVDTTGTPSASSVKDTYGPLFAAVAGQRFEFSLYAEQYGVGITNVCAAVAFYDSALAAVGAAVTDVCSTTAYSTTAPNLLSEWGRSYVLTTAPANTAYVLPFVRATFNGSGTGGWDMTRVFFGETPIGQTQPSPWAPGGITTIDGSHLATDLVIANTIRSSGATALGTGTGFWLDATSTPTFRVGNPSGDRFEFDGTNTVFRSTNFTVDSTGVTISPTSSGGVYAGANAYRFTVSSGDLAVTGYEVTSSTRGLFQRANYSGTDADRATQIDIAVRDEYTSGGPGTQAAVVSLFANELTSSGVSKAFVTTNGTGTTTCASAGNECIGLQATDLTVNAEAWFSGISGDGSGKVACVKSDGALGTCNASSITTSGCTCS